MNDRNDRNSSDPDRVLRDVVPPGPAGIRRYLAWAYTRDAAPPADSR